jgi:hypothetical protein
MLNVVMLNVVMLSIVMLSVIMLECRYAESSSTGTNDLAYLPRSSVEKPKTFHGMKSK